ncbi:MAG: flagellar protein FliS [Gemmatimonadaceae bacterium]
MSERVRPSTAGAKLSPDAVPAAGEPRATSAVSVPERYEQLLGKLAHAAAELESGDPGARSTSLEEASGIVFDLLYALDFRRGGETVPRLAALYGYIGNELLSVALTGDRTQLGHLRDMITTLRKSWYDSEAAA